MAAAAAPNTIAERQNEEQFLRLLRARSRTYAVASHLQEAQLLLVVLLPGVSAVAGLVWPALRPHVALAALVIAVLDTAWLDRWQRRKVKAAAKISEQFDCELLGMPWNKLVAGKRLDPEQVEGAVRAWRGGDAGLRDWYPAEVGDAPLPLARAMCQRVNAWYDGNLRQRYSAWLLGGVCAAFVTFLLVAVAAGLPLLDLTSTVLAPATPALICIPPVTAAYRGSGEPALCSYGRSLERR